MKFNLLHAEENYVPHCGLKTVATYAGESGYPYKIVFWHSHAPVTIEAEVHTLKFDVPHMWVDKFGNPSRTEDGRPKITNQLCILCPKTKDGLYMKGFSPEEQKSYLTTHKLVRCKYALDGIYELEAE